MILGTIRAELEDDLVWDNDEFYYGGKINDFHAFCRKIFLSVLVGKVIFKPTLDALKIIKKAKKKKTADLSKVELLLFAIAGAQGSRANSGWKL